jgi:hypothetical protein
VGFGELGTGNPQHGSTYEVNEINQPLSASWRKC